MSYFAAAVVRESESWSALELSLADAADVEDVAERLREVRPAAEISLLFVESDDSYLVIMRLDNGDDLRVFGSDSAFAEESRIGKVLLGDISQPAIDLDVDVDVAADDDDSGTDRKLAADVDPAGDAELLTDLGVPGSRLLKLCRHEGMLPSDITAEVCQAIGCGDEVEELREA
jgi:putative tRNA adenosine deaminase-associated protein